MAITMSNLNNRTAALEGRAATNPITMKGLSDRLSNLERTAKKWEQATLVIYRGTNVSNTIALPLPQNIRNIASGAKHMFKASGEVKNPQNNPTSVNDAITSIDANNFYYTLNPGRNFVTQTDVNITLVVYK